MFNKILKELRTEKGITQQELSKHISVSDRTIGYYESGDRFPDQDVLEEIANYFNVSIDYLLGKSSMRENSKEIEELKNELPEGLSILRRATKELDEESKQTMIALMKTFVDSQKKK